MIDRIILGHNQFFGVNHLIAQTGNEREAYFSDLSRIFDIIEFSIGQGVRGMMMSTHQRAALLSEEIVRRPTLQDQLGIYLLIPYAAKYIKQANEKGLVNVVMDALAGGSLQDKVSRVIRSGVGVVSKDAKRLLTALVDFEVAPFRKLNLRAIFLHDVVTDLILGWDLPDVLEVYSRHIQKKYNAIPAFCTKNLPRLMQLLERTEIENPLIMASINKLGYQVNPSREAFEECLRTRELRLLAMSTLAAGYLKPKEAYDYLFSLPRVESVVVGVSTKEHAVETFDEIRKHLTQPKEVLPEMEMAV